VDAQPATTLSDRLVGYIEKSLSRDNRKTWDGHSNATHRVVIEFAEVGSFGDEPEGFWFEVKIPRQSDNDLGLSVRQSVSCRNEAASILRTIAGMLDEETTCPKCGNESLPANSSSDYCPACGHEWER
jgi:hypothetical protein